jgi:hypothetical protein
MADRITNVTFKIFFFIITAHPVGVLQKYVAVRDLIDRRHNGSYYLIIFTTMAATPATNA